MRIDAIREEGTPIPGKLVDLLSYLDCLEQLGCSEEQAARFVDERLGLIDPVLVGRIEGPARAGAALPAAA